MPDSMTQISSSGPPGTKVNIAVLGDGFADGADQTTYNNKVNDLLFNGLFKNDYYFKDIQAFNVYRVNLISVDFGVGTKTYNNGTLLNTVTKNTALGYDDSGPGRTAGWRGAPKHQYARKERAQHVGPRLQSLLDHPQQSRLRRLRGRRVRGRSNRRHLAYDRP